jgi:hypothetical protein
LPIHTRCDCRVAPLVDGTDYGRVVNRELYRELKSSGDLARLNRQMSARGTGRQRARQAAARRQGQLDGVGRRGDQGVLELRPPASARGLADDLAAGAARRNSPIPAVRQHGELGPVLVNDRHAYTRVTPSRAGAHRLDADLDELRRTDPPPPAKVTTQRPPARPTEPAPAPTVTPVKAARRPRYSVESPEVLRRAQRRNISPEAAAEQLNARAARRSAEQAATRKEARNLTVDSPKVIAAAERYGVTPDEVLVARERVRDVRRVIAGEAAQVQARAFADLDNLGTVTINRPPRVGATSDMGGALRRGEWDWLEQLDERERARLSRSWYTDAGGHAPDQVAAMFGNQLGRELTSDDAVTIWLDHNRRIEAAGALRRGKLPSDRAYSGAVDPDGLLPDFSGSGYSVTRVLGDDLDAAAHIAQVDRQLMRREAEDYLGDGLDPTLGAPAYRMSFQAWEAEVRDLEYAVREGIDAELTDAAGDVVRFTAEEAAARLDELVPYYLDEPGTSFEELYARIIVTAGRAGREVPDYARVPWS